MDDWDNFYMLAGSTGGTLIGLIFVVITLGIDHAEEGDELRGRLYVTPILVYFTTLLVIAMVMVPPMPHMARALSLGVIGCAGLAYVMNLTLLSRGKGTARSEGLTEGLRLLFYVLLPLTAYALFAMSAVAWWLEAPFANAITAFAVMILLLTALRNSWMITLAIARRE
jgi:hypothetical protein